MSLPQGFTLSDFPTLASTNDHARGMAAAGAAHGTVVRADEQTAGRGRRGRSWYSPRGNLYCSILLDRGADPDHSAELAFVAAVSLRAALTEFAPRSAFACKWPNDILCAGRKIAGMLLESAGPMVVLGVGVNLAAAPDIAQYPTTSLRACAVEVDPTAMLERFCARLDPWYRRWRSEGFAPVRAEWLDHAAGLGGPVSVRVSETATLEGSFFGLDEGGALLLDTPDGRRPVLAGDVFFAA